MPTLRRSKSLNDKIAKQKNRTGDIIRDPRSRDVPEGRTRQNIDNFQALVLLRKQTEDKARQLELAYSYATNGHTYLRCDLPGSGKNSPRGGPTGGVQLPYPPATTASATSGSGGVRTPRQVEGGADQSSSRIPAPAPAVQRRQKSVERESKGFSGMGVRRQESYTEGQTTPLRPITQLRVRDSQRGQRPLSMIEPRTADSVASGGGGREGGVSGRSSVIGASSSSGVSGSTGGVSAGAKLFHPVHDEMRRKDHVIHNLTESQKTLNAHNQQLLGKVDELDFLNHRLKDILDGHGIAYDEATFMKLHNPASSSSSSPSPQQVPPTSVFSHHPTRHQRSQSLLYGDVIRIPQDTTTVSSSYNPVSSFKPSFNTPVSPNSEASVSGYGSLASGSACGENFAGDTSLVFGKDPAASARHGLDHRLVAARTARIGDYDDDDDTLALSEIEISKGGSLDSNRGKGEDSLAKFSSSSGEDSLGQTPNKDRSGMESIHEKLDQVLELGKSRGSDSTLRIEELEKEVTCVTAQRDAVLERYKLIVEEHERQLRRDERVQEQLRSLLEKHGEQLEQVVLKQLQDLQEELWDLGQEVSRQIGLVLDVLAASPASSSSSSSSSSSKSGVKEQQVQALVDKVVDLIGPEYLRLGRRLGLTQLELERIDNACDSRDVKTRMILHNWLRRRQREEKRGEGGCKDPPSRALDQALRDVDKDIRLFNHTAISTPERQALRNCLPAAIDHVTDPSLVLDHMIALNELTPGGITFVREVLDRPERALARLWHVSEYRGTGIISRLALALERSNYQHVSCRLTDELEMQNSRLHSQHSHTLIDELQLIDQDDAPSPSSIIPTTSTTTQVINSRLPTSQSRSKSRSPASMLPRPRSFKKATAESAVPLPVRKSSLSSSSSSSKSSSSLSSRELSTPRERERASPREAICTPIEETKVGSSRGDSPLTVRETPPGLREVRTRSSASFHSQKDSPRVPEHSQKYSPRAVEHSQKGSSLLQDYSQKGSPLLRVHSHEDSYRASELSQKDSSSLPEHFQKGAPLLQDGSQRELLPREENAQRGSPLLPEHSQKGAPLLPEHSQKGAPLLPEHSQKGAPLLPEHFQKGSASLPEPSQKDSPKIPDYSLKGSSSLPEPTQKDFHRAPDHSQKDSSRASDPPQKDSPRERQPAVWDRRLPVPTAGGPSRGGGGGGIPVKTGVVVERGSKISRV